jgi:hypothetical protein
VPFIAEEERDSRHDATFGPMTQTRSSTAAMDETSRRDINTVLFVLEI